MRLLIFYAISLLALSVNAQDGNRYIVHFTDKENNGFSIDEPTEFLSVKSIQRRVKWDIPIDKNDLPVNAEYINLVAGTGAKVFYASKWMNCLLIETTGDNLTEIETFRFVENVEFVAPETPLSGRIEKVSNKLDLEQDINAPQNDLIGTDQMNEAGFNGEGIVVGVIDAGFSGVDIAGGFSHLHENNRISHTFNFVGNSTEVYGFHDHGTKVLSTMAGYIPGEYRGVIKDASFQLYITEDISSEYIIEEYNWLFAAEKADSAGVDILTTSLGYYSFDDPAMDYNHEDLNGHTSVITRATDMAASKGIPTIFSSGNQGNKTWGRITFPSDCFNCFSVGSVNSLGIVSAFSSGGPTADNRIKPDVVAMGEGAAVINKDNSVVFNSGTSLAAPQLAGLLAGIMGVFPEINPLSILETIKLTANNHSTPDNSRGWGIPHFRATVNGLYNIEQQGNLAFFPNPAEDDLYVQVLNPSEIPNLTFEVVDLAGRRIHQGELQFNFYQQRQSIDISLIPKGIYLLLTRQNGIEKSTRIMIK